MDEDEDTNADLSIQEIPADSFLPSQLKSRIPRSHRHAQDTSLQVDMPLDEKPPHALEIEDEPRSSSRSNPTARTYSFGRDEPKERKSKYFPSHKDEDDENEDVIVHASSSPSPPKRSRTNPFTTTREASDKRRDLPRRSNLHSSKERPIELISPSRPLAVARDRNLPQKAGRSMVDWLGISDSNGRPNKGVVGGTKAKRRV